MEKYMRVKQVACHWPSVIFKSQGKWLVFQLTPSETATDEWVAQSGMKVNLPWHVLCKAIFLSGKIESYQKSQSREDRRLSHQGISNAWVKAQWSHFKGIEILWSDCGEDQSVIRPVGKEITAMDLCKIAALWSEKNRKANYSLSAAAAAAAAAKLLQSCPTLRPHRRQPTRLPRPWDSPGKNSGVSFHFLLH